MQSYNNATKLQSYNNPTLKTTLQSYSNATFKKHCKVTIMQHQKQNCKVTIMQHRKQNCKVTIQHQKQNSKVLAPPPPSSKTNIQRIGTPSAQTQKPEGLAHPQLKQKKKYWRHARGSQHNNTNG